MRVLYMKIIDMYFEYNDTSIILSILVNFKKNETKRVSCALVGTGFNRTIHIVKVGQTLDDLGL